MKEQAILKLYEQYDRDNRNSKEYDKLLRKFNVLRGEFDKQLTKDQQKILKQLIYLMNCMASQETKEYYIERVQNRNKTD